MALRSFEHMSTLRSSQRSRAASRGTDVSGCTDCGRRRQDGDTNFAKVSDRKIGRGASLLAGCQNPVGEKDS